MADDIDFDTMPVTAGECLQVSPLIRRIVAANPSPFTFTGTCSYIVGRGQVAVIDPGPDLPSHLDALLDAVRNETVTHILVSHTHRDHSPGARALKEATGAPILGCGVHRQARPLVAGETYRVLAVMDFACPCGRSDALLDVGVDFAWCQTRFRLLPKPKSNSEPTPHRVAAPKETV